VVVIEEAMPDHTAAFAVVKRALTSGEGKVIEDLHEVAAIGHRGGAGWLEIRPFGAH